MKRVRTRTVEQFSLFASPVGTFLREGCLQALQRQEPYITDFPLLRELTVEAVNYKASGNHVLNAASTHDDIEALLDCIERINDIIEADDKNRIQQLTTHRPGFRLSEDLLEALFDFRTAARELVIFLYNLA